MIPFAELNKHIDANSRIWIYQFQKQLVKQDLAEIESYLTKFTASWESHGNPLKAKSLLVQNNFIVFTVDEKEFEASGCSIDKSVAALKEINTSFKLDLFNRLNVAVFKNNSFIFYSSTEIIDAIAKGNVSSEDLFLDISITSAQDIQHILKPIQESWFYKRVKHA